MALETGAPTTDGLPFDLETAPATVVSSEQLAAAIPALTEIALQPVMQDGVRNAEVIAANRLLFRAHDYGLVVTNPIRTAGPERSAA